MKPLLGIVIIVTIKANGKEYALGMRTDDFDDEEQAKRAMRALCSSLDYSASRLIDGKPIVDISHPFFLK